MSTQDEPQEVNEQQQVEGRAVSRRDFLKMAAIAGGAITVGGGLVSAAAGCGSSNKNTTSSAQGGGTQVSSSAEKGDEIKLGYVVPITGNLAPFASGATWAQSHFEKYVGQGIVMGDKKLHPIKVYRQDTQSLPSRAGSVTGDLINNTGVDLVLAAGTPDTVNPAVAQAENFEAPFISNWCEWHAFVAGAPKGTYQWGYTFAFDDVGTMANYAGVLRLSRPTRCWVSSWPTTQTARVRSSSPRRFSREQVTR